MFIRTKIRIRHAFCYIIGKELSGPLYNGNPVVWTIKNDLPFPNNTWAYFGTGIFISNLRYNT